MTTAKRKPAMNVPKDEEKSDQIPARKATYQNANSSPKVSGVAERVHERIDSAGKNGKAAKIRSRRRRGATVTLDFSDEGRVGHGTVI